MSESKVLISMRLAAWERAKAELSGVLHTYWSELGDSTEQFAKLDSLIVEFEKSVDDFIY